MYIYIYIYNAYIFIIHLQGFIFDAYMHAYIHTYTHTPPNHDLKPFRCVSGSESVVDLRLYVCMYVCMYVCICPKRQSAFVICSEAFQVYVCMYVCMYV